jgi:riboflavin synthase
MFTGIITGLGTVTRLDRRRGGARLTVRPPARYRRFGAGESVSVSGVCLTSIRAGRDLIADLSGETLRRSTLGSLRPGSRVNLERALRWGDPLSGHFVMGHVDAVARVREIEASRNSWTVRLDVPRGLSSLVVSKGSVALEGVSLTVAGRGRGSFTVVVIPETHRRTTLSRLTVGDAVNFEADVFARYGFAGAMRRAGAPRRPR